MIAALLAATFSGLVPSSLPAPQRVVWVSAGAATGVACTLPDSAHWSCRVEAGDPDAVSGSGVVVVVGEQGVAYAPVVSAPADAMTVRRDGRLIAVAPGSLPERSNGLHVTASTLDRSPARPNTTLLTARAVENIDVVSISPESTWIAWDDADEDTFVTLAGDGIAIVRIPLAAFTDSDVAQPYIVTTSQPMTLTGTVENPRREPVARTDVELFAPLVAPAGQPSNADILALPMVRVSRTATDDGGAFAFDRIGPGPFVAVVTDPTRGRARAVIRSPLDPTTIRVTPPPLATGRVLDGGAPAPGVRVRFVPNVRTVAASLDVRDVASVEQQTGDDGRFALALPPLTAGVVQAIGPDGNATRVPLLSDHIDSDIDLGDIQLPGRRRVTVRVDAGAACVLRAVGPIGSLGIATVSETAASANVHWFDLPESGQWMLDADCGGETVAVVPAVVSVPADGPETTVDARLARPR